MKLVFSVLLLLLFDVTFSQSPCTCDIVFNDYDDVTISSGRLDTTYVFRQRKKNIYISLIDCKGASFVKVLDMKGKVLEEGKYSGAIDTLASYVIHVNINEPYNQTYGVYKYFQPLRDQEWIFYQKKKKIRILYDKGIRID